MAQRRMFSLEVCDTDKFLDMSASAQALYFHLGLHGDDDGFVASPKRIARAAGCNDDDLRLLAAKGFIIPFDSGVVVITDWNVNNTLKNDRYHETVYQDEKSKICRLTNGKYALASRLETDWNQDVSNLEPEHNITKLNLTKLRKEEADALAVCDLLYIDDLFKTDCSGADLRLAYELINSRYIAGRPVIISSERSLPFIGGLKGKDGEAVAGRIFEMCGKGRFCVAVNGDGKNIRIR